MLPPTAGPVPSPPSPRPPSREEEADVALQSTSFSRGARPLLLVGFLALEVSGIVAGVWGRSPQGVGLEGHPSRNPWLELLPSSATLGKVGGLSDLWRLLPTPETTRSVEKALADRSTIAHALRPSLQSFLYRTFGCGNEQVIPAPAGWLFFRKDLEYVNSKPFLSPYPKAGAMRTKAADADPVESIVDFHRQLASRNIRLLVVPVPVKPSIEGHRFVAGAKPPEAPLQNASYSGWIQALQSRGVSVLDPAPLLLERACSTKEPQFLRTDTHWTPGAMEAVAKAVALKIQPNRSAKPHAFVSTGTLDVTAHGDTVALLGLPKNQTAIPPQTVRVHPVPQNDARANRAKDAEVLLLGDSFSNIYSLGAMGWGESAGFPEHLGAQLGRPVDSLLRNSDGAFATREMLIKELASGKDRLRGKTFVVWEFATRELSSGLWKTLPLPEAKAQTRSFFCPPSGARQKVRGIVEKAAPVPRPGSVPYKEHIVALHLVDVVLEEPQDGEKRDCLVYTWSMRDQQTTPAARLRPGDPVSFELVPWEDVSENLEKFQRSELDEPELLLEPATWSGPVR